MPSSALLVRAELQIAGDRGSFNQQQQVIISTGGRARESVPRRLGKIPNDARTACFEGVQCTARRGSLRALLDVGPAIFAAPTARVSFERRAAGATLR